MKKQFILVAVFSFIVLGFSFANFAQAGPGDPIPSVPIGLDGDQGPMAAGEPIAGVEVIRGAGIINVGTMPTSNFYFFKEFRRGITRLFTFSAIAKAELELKITNEKAAELQAVAKTSTVDSPAGLEKALKNYTKAQERLNKRLLKLKENSENPNVAKLFKEVDEKTAKHAELLEQVAVNIAAGTGTITNDDTDVSKILNNTRNNIQKTFTISVEKEGNAKQRAEEQIERAGVAIDEANDAMQQVSTTRGMWRPLTDDEVDMKVTVPKQTQSATFGEKSKIDTRGGSFGGDVQLKAVKHIHDNSHAHVGGDVQLKDSGKTMGRDDAGDTDKPGISDQGAAGGLDSYLTFSKGHLNDAKTAFAEGKYGKAYGLARSAEAFAENILKKIDAFTIKQKSAENESPRPTDRKTAESDSNNSPQAKPISVEQRQKPTESKQAPIKKKEAPQPSTSILPIDITSLGDEASATVEPKPTTTEPKSAPIEPKPTTIELRPVTVAVTATKTTLTSSLNPSTSNQSVTFTATVTGGMAPTGFVTFLLNDVTNLGSSKLNERGVATVTTSTLSIGAHTVTATYNGDETHSGSTSPSVNHVVNSVRVSPTAEPAGAMGQTSGSSLSSGGSSGGVSAY